MYEQIRKDFKNVFLKEVGESVTVTRAGQTFSLQGVLDGSKGQFEYDADIQVGDSLSFKASNVSAVVKSVQYETESGERTILIALL